MIAGGSYLNAAPNGAHLAPPPRSKTLPHLSIVGPPLLGRVRTCVTSYKAYTPDAYLAVLFQNDGSILAYRARSTPDGNVIASRRSLVPRRTLQVLFNGAPERVGDSSWYDVQDSRNRLDSVYMYVYTLNTITLLHKPLTSSNTHEFASGYYSYIR